MPAHLTYLVFELAWAFPVLAIQWIAGGDTLRRYRRLLLLGAAVPTVYLCLADALAIHLGIWTIRRGRTTDLTLAGVPLEEALFFASTNLMIVQTIILVRLSAESDRVRALMSRAGRRRVASSCRLPDGWTHQV